MLTPIRDALSPYPDQPITWLAIVMAATIVAVLTGALATLGHPSHRRCHSVERMSIPDVDIDDIVAAQTARDTIASYDLVAYPNWAVAHPGQPCPDRLAELNEYAGWTTTLDPWGKSYQFLCGYGIHGIRTRSAGPDGLFDTADDITSDDRGSW